MNKFTVKSAALAAMLATAAGSALAGGFQLTEQSALALGRAYAGVGVDGTDISGVYYNPASMVLHTGTQFQFGGVGIGLNLPYSSDKGSEYDENGRKKPEFVPHLFATRQLTDKAWMGLSFTIPFGLATEYSSDWEQSNRGDRAEIELMDLKPNFAYKITDKLSVGAGVSIQYVEAKLGFNIAGNAADVQVDSVGYGYNLGLMWSPMENLRFGISYRSKVKHEGDGFVKSRLGKMDAGITMDAPASWLISAAWDVNKEFSFYATARKTDWSSFQALTLDSELITHAAAAKMMQQGIPAQQIQAAWSQLPKSYPMKTEWRDTYLFTVGSDVRINDFWTLRGGLGFERSPISNPTLRTGTIPDADRWWFALGSSFHWSKNFQTDVSFAHLHGVHERSLYNEAGGEKIGEFKRLDAYLVGIQAQYRF